jgi:hypothetical protein
MQTEQQPDLSKVDISNDFRDFPQLYSCPEDIEKFIIEHKIDAPVLSRILQLRKGTLLGLTPTEDKFIFEEFFDYVYDVFRVPVPETYKRMKEWLTDYLEGQLVMRGIEGIKERAYDSVKHSFDVKLRFVEFCEEEKIPCKRPLTEINYFKEIEKTNINGSKTDPDLIEYFYIKTDSHGIQPFRVDGEYYARVNVYPDRVYICGCDDFSWTLTTKNENEAKGFARYLKCAAPVWNFCYPKTIHKDLEFTN